MRELEQAANEIRSEAASAASELQAQEQLAQTAEARAESLQTALIKGGAIFHRQSEAWAESRLAESEEEAQRALQEEKRLRSEAIQAQQTIKQTAQDGRKQQVLYEEQIRRLVFERRLPPSRHLQRSKPQQIRQC